MTSEQKKLAKKALEAAIAYVKKQIQKDKENRYSLLAEWELPTVRCSDICPAFSWEGDYIRVIQAGEDSIHVTVKPYTSTAEHPVCDGCSLSPDLRGCLEGAVFHDPWYLEMERMSKDTGISIDCLRQLGDTIFGNIAKAIRGDGFIARTYYWAVRVFGGLYHKSKNAVLAVLVALGILALSGCSGCAIPDVFDDPVDSPTYVKE